MRRFVSISAIFLVLSLISMPVLAQQQYGAGQPGKPRAQTQERLERAGHPVLGNLSEEQQEAMASLFAEHRSAMMQHNLRLRAKQAELDVLLAAPEFNQTQVDAVSAEILALKGETMKLRNEQRRTVFEETGHLMRGKSAGRFPGMAGSGKRPRMGRGGCPMMSGYGGQAAE